MMVSKASFSDFFNTLWRRLIAPISFSGARLESSSSQSVRKHNNGEPLVDKSQLRKHANRLIKGLSA